MDYSYYLLLFNCKIFDVQYFLVTTDLDISKPMYFLKTFLQSLTALNILIKFDRCRVQ